MQRYSSPTPSDSPCSHAVVVAGPSQKELPKKTDCPHMCAYKLVTVKFKWWGLQNKVENFIQKVRVLCGILRVGYLRKMLGEATNYLLYVGTNSAHYWPLVVTCIDVERGALIFSSAFQVQSILITVKAQLN